MKRGASVVVLSILVAASPVLASIPVGLTTDLTLTHDGEVRTYDVLRPFGSVGPPAPLVIDLHGFSSNGDQQRSLSGWDVIANAQGVVVAWPDGTSNSWNGGTCCGDAVANDVDDVGFIRAMVTEIQAGVKIDPRRIYVTGLSNGGAMTQRLACEAADLFAAAAPMAFPVPYADFANECQTSESIPVLSFMGLTDVLVSYADAAPSYLAWREENGCDSGGVAPEVSEVYGGSDCSIDTSCAEPGVEVGLCSVTGVAFDPPLDIYSGHILYANEDAFDISQRAWDFMKVQERAALVPVGTASWILPGLFAAAGSLALVRKRRHDVDE